MAHNQFDLLKTKRFLPFFLTQFLGAFNDNVFKQSLIILLAFNAASMTTLPASTLTNLCAGLFILPYFLFSATAGQLADKYEKTKLIKIIKGAEIIIMSIAVIGFQFEQLWLLLIALFLMGTHSTAFGPIKYAILPQALTKNELVGGNALVEMGTSLAILIGSMLGGFLIAIKPEGKVYVSWAIVIIAMIGFISCWRIPRAESANPDLKINWNPLTETWRNFLFIKQNKTILLSILAISWFWFYGATFLTQIPNYTREVLGGDEHVVTFLLSIFSVGIAIGSLLCEKLSDKKVELGLVPFGSIGLTCFGIDLYLATKGLEPQAISSFSIFIQNPINRRVIFDLLGIGIFGGFYIVPLYALIQARSEPSHRARIIAGNNIINAFLMVLSAALAIIILSVFKRNISELFLTTAILSAFVSIYIYSVVPEFFMRFLIWIFLSCFYNIKKTNLQNIPDEGGCVLVCNHVSFYDAFILSAAIRRPPRFVMAHTIFKTPILSFIFKTAKAIPIAPAKEDPAQLEKAYADIAQALKDGEIVCIFPEGRITDTGDMYPFKNGIMRIIETTPVPVIPIALRGMWGSISSRKNGAAFSKLPRRLRSAVEVNVGVPIMPNHVSPQGLQAEVEKLRGELK